MLVPIRFEQSDRDEQGTENKTVTSLALTLKLELATLGRDCCFRYKSSFNPVSKKLKTFNLLHTQQVWQ